MKNINKCIDCKRNIDKRSKRCRSCAKKGNLSANYKNGVSLKQNYCIDCGELLKHYKSKRCATCAMKFLFKNSEDNPMYGKHHSFKTRKEMSRISKNRLKDKKKHNMYGKTHSPETRKKISLSLMGFKHLLETRKKMSRTWKRKLKNPKNHNMYGKTFSLEHRKNLGLSRIGKNNPNYVDGRSNLPYPLEFNDALKYKIRERDNFECQNCGMTEEEHLSVEGQVLHVHHIDYNKFNCKEVNLTTLCLYCNTRANFNRTFWQEHYTKKIKEKYNGKSTLHASN